MPRKSTLFTPKPSTGLLLRDHRADRPEPRPPVGRGRTARLAPAEPPDRRRLDLVAAGRSGAARQKRRRSAPCTSTTSPSSSPFAARRSAGVHATQSSVSTVGRRTPSGGSRPGPRSTTSRQDTSSRRWAARAPPGRRRPGRRARPRCAAPGHRPAPPAVAVARRARTACSLVRRARLTSAHGAARPPSCASCGAGSSVGPGTDGQPVRRTTEPVDAGGGVVDARPDRSSSVGRPARLRRAGEHRQRRRTRPRGRLVSGSLRRSEPAAARTTGRRHAGATSRPRARRLAGGSGGRLASRGLATARAATASAARRPPPAAGVAASGSVGFRAGRPPRRRPPAPRRRARGRRLVLVEVLQHDAVELEQPLAGVGGPSTVDAAAFSNHSALRRATGVEQRVGVGVPEPRRPGSAGAGPPGRLLQGEHGGVGLTEVASGAGQDDDQLDPLGLVERRDVGVVGDGQGPLGTAERTLAVGQHGQVIGLAGDASGGAQLGQRLGPLPCGVGGQPARLAHHADASGHGASRPGVRERLLRVVVEQPTGHHEVARDQVGGLPGERAQLARARPGRASGIDVVRDGEPGQLAALLATRVVPAPLDSARRPVAEPPPAAARRRPAPALRSPLLVGPGARGAVR